jgi:transcriptional regulator GlxA family with amidase domain
MRHSTKDAKPGARARSGPVLRVAFVLAERFTLSAFAGFVDVLRLAADEGDRSRPLRCSWVVLGVPGQPIPSSSGLHVLAQQPFDSPQSFDYVVVVGGLLHGGQRLGRGALTFLHQAAQVGVPLVGVCTGSFLLARAGLLDGYLTSVSWFHREEFAAAFPGLAMAADRQYVIDRNRITCAGGTSVVHLAAELVERHCGRAAASKSLRILIQNPQAPARALQPEPVLDRAAQDHRVRKAMLQIEDSLHRPLSIEQIAAGLGMSTRQLERRFKADLGVSPAAFRQRLRLARASWLLQTTDLSVTEVALDCGCSDASHLSRLLYAHTGRRPSALRRGHPPEKPGA